MAEYLNQANYDYSSSSGPFSKNSYKIMKERSNRSLDFDFDYEKYNENELIYKILNNSKFVLHTNKKGNRPFIIYDEIKLCKKEKEKENENKTIDEIKNATTSNEKLLSNYKKFLLFLEEFEKSLENEFNNNYKLKITLNFETQNININNDFIITCLYKVELPEENEETYKDENILTNGLSDGFQYMLNELNSSNYSNIEYS